MRYVHLDLENKTIVTYPLAFERIGLLIGSYEEDQGNPTIIIQALLEKAGYKDLRLATIIHKQRDGAWERQLLVRTQTLEFEKILVASTVHITQAEADSNMEILDRNPLVRAEGFMIHTRISDKGDDLARTEFEEKQLSKGGQDLFRMARSNGCDWLLFDADGPEVPNVSTEEW